MMAYSNFSYTLSAIALYGMRNSLAKKKKKSHISQN